MPTVAIIGATPSREKFGNKSVRAHAQRGYQVFPIHPDADEIEGLPVYRRLTDVPAPRLDRVSMYVRPEVGLKLLDDIAAKGCDELWLNPGTASPELIRQAQSLGLNTIEGCSIVDLGISPSSLPD